MRPRVNRRPRFAPSSLGGVAIALVLGLACVAALAAGDAPGSDFFAADQLSEGVWLLRPRHERADLGNALLVERQDGLLVVESQGSEQAGRLLVEAVRSLSDKPLRYLVLSHAHAESAGGASAFPDATLVIATVGTRDALLDPSFDFGAEVRARTDPPSAWVAPRKRMPVMVIYARTELEDPLNEVELVPLGHTHTETDLMVRLPNQNIVYAGALLFPDLNPYAADGKIGSWLSALNYVAKTSPALAIPLHGQPIDVRGVRSERDAFAWLRGQVELAFVDQVEVPRMVDWVMASETFAQRFDLDASPSFLRTLVERVVEEAVAERKKHGAM
jgi:glyoxylase-like metal-dependent hydrolase (beta-lactamase superfamily II)